MLRRAFIKLLGVVPFLSVSMEEWDHKKTIWTFENGSTILFDDDIFYQNMKSRKPMIISNRTMRVPLELKGEFTWEHPQQM